jgi:hypothetical protein
MTEAEDDMAPSWTNQRIWGDVDGLPAQGVPPVC